MLQSVNLLTLGLLVLLVVGVLVWQWRLWYPKKPKYRWIEFNVLSLSPYGDIASGALNDVVVNFCEACGLAVYGNQDENGGSFFIESMSYIQAEHLEKIVNALFQVQNISVRVEWWEKYDREKEI